ncbi:MAG: hypothetical protein GXY61_13460, partial [Lentisphaerae bacterium]|nr:hypothetical protein [Lentisphaerota bacterium]
GCLLSDVAAKMAAVRKGVAARMAAVRKGRAAKMAAVREQGSQDGCDMINVFVWRSDCNEWMKSSE